MRSSVSRIADKALRVAQEALIEAKTNVRKKYASEYKQDLEVSYNAAVAEWYKAYIPKKYKRTRKLYSLFSATVDSDGYVDWEISDELSYPSWGAGEWSPFLNIVEVGFHGGWVGSGSGAGWVCYHEPFQSTPIPELFEPDVNEADRVRKLRIKDEFYRVFWPKYDRG